MRSILTKYVRWQRERRRGPGGHGGRIRPHVELLEAREVPSTFTVTRLADDTLAGSLRWAITQANAEPGDDTIAFDVTGTISLTRALPDLSSNIDLQGPGADLLTVRGQGAAGGYGIFTV